MEEAIGFIKISMDSESLYGYGRNSDMKSHFLLLVLTVLRSALYGRMPDVIGKLDASPDVSYILGLALVSRCLGRRDEEQNTKALARKMDPTTGVHVVGLRLYSALLAETMLSCLQGKKMQIGAGDSKTSASSYNVVSNTVEKPVTREAGFCIGPLLLCCLTFSTTSETYADFH